MSGIICVYVFVFIAFILICMGLVGHAAILIALSVIIYYLSEILNIMREKK